MSNLKNPIISIFSPLWRHKRDAFRWWDHTFQLRKHHFPIRLYRQQVCPLNSDIPGFVIVCLHIFLYHTQIPFHFSTSFFVFSLSSCYIIPCLYVHSSPSLLFLPVFAILPFSPPNRAGESPVDAAVVPSVDVVGSWTDISDVKDSSPFCPTGLSLNYWCKYVAKTSLMQAVALKWKHNMSIKCDLCVIITHMPSDRGEKWLAN